MDQYDSQNPPHGQRPAESDTPIFDRLLAEWQAAKRLPGPTDPVAAVAGYRVPAARNHHKTPGR
ncbi:hypothetical protein OHT52_03610 [Streptomyces sp. NBC_00247]|nr:hypothetical protein [Streptomyces sp. NBC_00247]